MVGAAMIKIDESRRSEALDIYCKSAVIARLDHFLEARRAAIGEPANGLILQRARLDIMQHTIQSTAASTMMNGEDQLDEFRQLAASGSLAFG